MSISVIVNGANGKMGALACQTLAEHPHFDLRARLLRQDNLGAVIRELKPQVVVDLTTAESVYENSLTIINNNAHPVIGTSGLIDTQVNDLKKLAKEKELGGIIVPNFSIGAVLMMQFAKMAAQLMPEVEIIEAHHQQKLDAPSGTAIKTAEMIAEARRQSKNQLEIREVIANARGADYQETNIHSLRLPGFLASQQVIFGNTGENLTITHNSIDRSAFMPGLILACQAVLKQNNLIYGLESLIN